MQTTVKMQSISDPENGMFNLRSRNVPGVCNRVTAKINCSQSTKRVITGMAILFSIVALISINSVLGTRNIEGNAIKFELHGDQGDWKTSPKDASTESAADKIQNDTASPTQQPVATKLYIPREPARAVRYVCKGICGGWGDRVKGMLSAFTMAVFSGRTYQAKLIQDGKPLTDFYVDDGLGWSNVDTGADYTVSCIDQPCDCLANAMNTDQWKHARIVEVNTNGDCSGTFFAKFNLASMLNLRPNVWWKSQVWREFMKPTDSIRKAVEDHKAQAAVHIRTGLIRNDVNRYAGTVEAAIGPYVDCVAKVIPECFKRSSVIVAIGDNADILQALVDKLKLTSWQRVITADNVGSLGHVERFVTGTNLVKRMIVEFEVMRRVKYLFAAPSGFSLMAWKVREYQDNLIYAGQECGIPFAFGNQYFTVAKDRRI